MSEPSLSVSDKRSGADGAMDKLKSRIARGRERARRMLPFISGMFAALLALFLYNFLFPETRPLTQNEVSTAVFNAMASATPRPAYSTVVYQIIQPSLVLIESDSPGENGESHTGLGSGVIINDVGDILTSLHVVANSSNIRVTFADGTQSNATVVASQPEKDIAVLQAELLPELFVPATLGNPAAMQVGDEAFVVGNPFGLYSSMSSGVISGFNRSFQPPGTSQVIEGLIQIDAAVNPGNSGGPLLNRSGHVVGIVTGIINPTEESFFIGIGFAVPINVAAGGAGLPPY
jgi:S1-C subfamily serine protease